MNYQQERSRKSKWFFGVVKALDENGISILELGYREKDNEVTLVTNTASADLMLIGEGYKVAAINDELKITEGK